MFIKIELHVSYTHNIGEIATKQLFCALHGIPATAVIL